MASRLALAKLARAASALNARTRADGLPAQILLTDERRLLCAIPSALALPKGSAVIVRHTDAGARARLAAELMPIARSRGLRLLVAGDAALAARIGADGLHLPEVRAREAFHWKARFPHWLVTAAAHSAHALTIAAVSGADACLLAPAFATTSHESRASLGVVRLRLLAAAAPIPVYALGGVSAATARRLTGARLAGLAAIDGLAPGQSE